MKASDVYLRAAELVDSRDVEESCVAIDKISPDDTTMWMSQKHFVNKYIRMMAPKEDAQGYWLAHSGIPESQRHDWRVLALLFMHQIALDEERRAP